MNGKILAAADRCRRSGPLADAVERENDGTIERRGIERRCRVAQMMLAEGKPLLPIDLGCDRLELAREQ